MYLILIASAYHWSLYNLLIIDNSTPDKSGVLNYLSSAFSVGVLMRPVIFFRLLHMKPQECPEEGDC